MEIEVIALFHRPVWWLMAFVVVGGGASLLFLAAYLVRGKLRRRKD